MVITMENPTVISDYLTEIVKKTQNFLLWIQLKHQPVILYRSYRVTLLGTVCGEETEMWGCSWGAPAYLQGSGGGILRGANPSIPVQYLLHPPSPSRTPSAKHNLSSV